MNEKNKIKGVVIGGYIPKPLNGLLKLYCKIHNINYSTAVREIIEAHFDFAQKSDTTEFERFIKKTIVYFQYRWNLKKDDEEFENYKKEIIEEMKQDDVEEEISNKIIKNLVE